MTKNVEDLREHLFATLEALRDKERPMEIDRARAISEVAKTVIESAKVENEYLKLNGGGESPFVSVIGKKNLPPALPNGITGITQHRLAG